MTDLEMTRLCANALGWTFVPASNLENGGWRGSHYVADGKFVEWASKYDPLHDDAQAMALVKRFGLSISGPSAKDADRAHYVWCAYEAAFKSAGHAQSTDLNRAICECVAKMREER